MATSLAGKPLVEASWALLRRDPSIIALLVVGSLAASVAFALIALPIYAVFGLPVDGTGNWLNIAVYAIALLASTLVSTFFLGAVVAAAMQRADGGDPTFGSALGAAWERRTQLLAWAALSTVVGIALRQLERFGLAGQVVRLLAGVGWAVATWFAIPVIMAEGTMPFETIKRSSHVLTSKFGSNVRATVRLGVIYILLWLGVFAVGMLGLFAFVEGTTKREALTTGSGIALILTALVGGFIVSACWQATSVYLRTVLYRYATGRPTPGVGQWVLPPMLGGPTPFADGTPSWTFPMTAPAGAAPSAQFGTPSAQFGTPSAQFGTPSAPSAQFGTPSVPSAPPPPVVPAPPVADQGAFLARPAYAPPAPPAPPAYQPPTAADVLPPEEDAGGTPPPPAPPSPGPWPGTGVFLPEDPSR